MPNGFSKEPNWFQIDDLVERTDDMKRHKSLHLLIYLLRPKSKRIFSAYLKVWALMKMGFACYS